MKDHRGARRQDEVIAWVVSTSPSQHGIHLAGMVDAMLATCRRK